MIIVPSEDTTYNEILKLMDGARYHVVNGENFRLLPKVVVADLVKSDPDPSERQMSGGSDNEFDVPLNLVALIDVFTNLLFFLMIGFAAKQVSVAGADDIKLPSSNTKAEIELSLVLAITKDQILSPPCSAGEAPNGSSTIDDACQPLTLSLCQMGGSLGSIPMGSVFS